MKKVYRAHPIMIAENMGKLLFLLIIPIFRGLISAFEGGFSEWLRGAWFDILTLTVIVIMAVIEWYCLEIDFDKEKLRVKSGIFYKKVRCIELKRVCAANITQPFYLKPIRAVHIVVDTLAGNSRNPDMDLTVSRALAERIISTQRLRRFDGGNMRIYKPNTVNIAILSVMISNSLAGVLFLSTFISQAGKLLSTTITERLVGTFKYFAQTLAFGIPPAAAAFAYILLFGWLYSVLTNMIRYQNFAVSRKDDTLLISGGVITNRDYLIDVKCISYIDIRQTLMSRLFGVYSVFINVVGFSKKKDDLSAVMPAATHSGLKRYMQKILPEYHADERQLKPNAGAVFKFIIEPIWACVLVPVITALICFFFEEWRDVAVFVGAMLMMPAIWFLAVRLIDFFTSGISFDGEYYTLRYSKGMFLHTVIIPKDKIAYVDLRQSIIQKMDRKCDVKLRTVYESRMIHHIRNLDRQNVMDLCGFDMGCYDETITPVKKCVRFKRGENKCCEN